MSLNRVVRKFRFSNKFFAVLLFFSCAGFNPAEIDDAAGQGNFSGALRIIEDEKKKFYPGQDIILYYLDKGMLAHYAGSYGDSSALLEEGERAIEAAYTKSISLEIGSYLINDTLKAYDGEDYEDIYINVFNALNYYHQGSLEDAMVEIRRMNNKIQFLSSKYGVFVSALQKKALEEAASIPQNPDSNSKFTDSALARYLGLLFHRDSNQYDDARIDQEQLKIAFANAPHLYTYPVPASIDEELAVPAGMARLNFIAFSGLSPVKKEETLRVPISLSNYVKISLPLMSFRPSSVNQVEVVFDHGEKYRLELLEDIEAVARETFKEKRNVIYIKTIIRAAAKGIASSALDAASDETEGTAALVLGILSLGNKIFAEASERADLRISRYFPGKAWVGGIYLKPGLYSFTVNYLDVSGKPLASFRQDDIMIDENKSNLMETVCLR